MLNARGEFDVKVTPLPLGGPADDATLGRLSIETEFRGEGKRHSYDLAYSRPKLP